VLYPPSHKASEDYFYSRKNKNLLTADRPNPAKSWHASARLTYLHAFYGNYILANPYTKHKPRHAFLFSKTRQKIITAKQNSFRIIFETVAGGMGINND